jgi:glutamyl-tRNA reductase
VFADIVIGASGAPYPIITKKIVQGALKARKNKPMFFIDIAVPRDVEPAVNDLDNAYVYDIDDLQAIADEHLKERKAEALKAEDIVKEEAEKFESWRASLEVVPTIVELRNHFENVARAELERALASLPEAGEKERNALELLAHNIVNKLLHEPTVMLKKCTEEGERRVASACRKLFCLEVPESTESTENNEDEDDDDRE